jgi:diacylglycerol kinase family enzyme
VDCLVLLNGDSGTAKTADLAGLQSHILAEFQRAGHRVSFIRIDETGMKEALESARDSRAEMLVAGGGDGTVSALAEIAWESSKVLGVLPCGTMNLYANTLKMPNDLFEAVTALANGHEGTADIATANGAPFINQFAIGFHPRAVRLRNRMNYGSRVGKIWATLKALMSVMTDPPSMRVEMTLDDGPSKALTVTALSVSNNLLGTGRELYADRYDGHCLGVYRAPRVTPGEAVKLIMDLIIGSWAWNEKVEIEEARHVVLRIPGKRGNGKALRDGELIDLATTIEFKIHENALKVQLPAINGAGID